MHDGLDLDQNVLIQVQSNTIAQQVIRIVHLEAATQQLMNEVERLGLTIDAMSSVQDDDLVKPNVIVKENISASSDN